jgi:hypothetical protein
MNPHRNLRKVIYRVATVALVIGTAALWIPTSWHSTTAANGHEFTQFELGILHPLQLIWHTWSDGIQFIIPEVRTVRLIISAVLSFVANPCPQCGLVQLYATKRAY